MNKKILRAIALTVTLCLLFPLAAFAAQEEGQVMQTIIISIEPTADNKQAVVERLCKTYDLSVVYDYSSLNMAALRSNKELTAEGLEKLLADVALDPDVLGAQPDQIIELDPREWEGFDEPVADAPVTRAQAVAEIWKQAGSPVVNHILPFSDVDQEADDFAEAVRWAAAEGVTAGTGNGLFSPDANVTKQQLAAMFYAYAKKQGKGFAGMWMFLLQAEDRDRIAAYAYEPMCWLTMKGVLKTDEEGNLNPSATVTAAELQQILASFAEALTKE
ncbi:MAG: S-layer homology domain-containing protein [Firmicutes bacterium]|nr:S-layer homology domain-containing protein [Bacillota bacterium]MBQ6294334.1 S-layer homology domain-containing protein [Bacillota bacterium]MBR0210160.1 S-layer homology domain-containing protein [Bacillota bacterium]